jgi:hypothetical protein
MLRNPYDYPLVKRRPENGRSDLFRVLRFLQD